MEDDRRPCPTCGVQDGWRPTSKALDAAAELTERYERQRTAGTLKLPETFRTRVGQWSHPCRTEGCRVRLAHFAGEELTCPGCGDIDRDWTPPSESAKVATLSPRKRVEAMVDMQARGESTEIPAMLVDGRLTHHCATLNRVVDHAESEPCPCGEQFTPTYVMFPYVEPV